MKRLGGGAVDLILGGCEGCDSGVVGGFVIQGMHGQIRDCPILQEPREGSGQINCWGRWLFTYLYLSCCLFISMFIFMFI